MTGLRYALAIGLMVTVLSAGTAGAQSALKDHDTQQPLDISAEDLNADNRNGRARFSGNVIVTQGGMTLKSDALLVFYDNPGGTDAPAISRLDATGAVELTSATEEVRADWGIYDVTQRLITFGGNVTLTQGDNALAGERLELNLVTGLARLDGRQQDGGRVRGSFGVPDADTDGDTPNEPGSDDTPDSRNGDGVDLPR